MPHFAAEVVHAGHQLSIADDARADAGTHGEVNQVFALTGTERIFGQSGAIGIVLHKGRALEMVFKKVADFHVIPALHIRRLENHAALGTHRAGRADSDSIDLINGQTCFGDQFFGNRNGLRECFERIIRIGRKPLIRENFAALVSNRKSHFCSADINA